MRYAILAMAFVAAPVGSVAAEQKSAVKASPLDAPIAPSVPTVRSEIRRGMDAAWACGLRYMLIDQTRIYSACIDDTHNRNRQAMGSDYEAFDIGLYRSAREHVAIQVKVISESHTTLYDASLFQSLLAVEVIAYQQALGALHLSDDQVAEAIKTPS